MEEGIKEGMISSLKEENRQLTVKLADIQETNNKLSNQVHFTSNSFLRILSIEFLLNR